MRYKAARTRYALVLELTCVCMGGVLVGGSGNCDVMLQLGTAFMWAAVRCQAVLKGFFLGEPSLLIKLDFRLPVSAARVEHTPTFHSSNRYGGKFDLLELLPHKASFGQTRSHKQNLIRVLIACPPTSFSVFATYWTRLNLRRDDSKTP
jgi:hypothetical protein